MKASSNAALIKVLKINHLRFDRIIRQINKSFIRHGICSNYLGQVQFNAYGYQRKLNSS